MFLQTIHKERGDPMDGVDIHTVVGRTMVHRCPEKTDEKMDRE